MGYGGWLCRRSTRRFVGNRRGPQRLTSTPVGAHERLPNRRGPQRLDLKPPWATVNGCQNYKILKPSYIFAKWLKYKKNRTTKVCFYFLHEKQH
jgi:hypothetical protein